MSSLATSYIRTPAGSTLAVHEVGKGPHEVVMIGGIAVRPLTETPLAPAFEAAARHGARSTLVDLPGNGASTHDGAPTMDAWIADIEHVFETRARAPAIWVGASVGAWLMLLIQSRKPAWFRAMCALAPAIDWDQQYVAPRLRDGRLGLAADVVTNPDGTALAHRDLLVSMAPHHLLPRSLDLAAPLHVVYGGRDEMAPADVTRRYFERATGAPCSATFFPEADHGLAKLDPAPISVHFRNWLSRQLGL